MSDPTIRGIQEAQEANLRLIASLKPNGSLGKAIQYGGIQVHRLAVTKTHVLTGSLRASHRIKQEGTRATIFIDPSTTNPRTGEKPSKYGITEHNRGGSHAFYGRTYAEDGKSIAYAVAQGYVKGLR